MVWIDLPAIEDGSPLSKATQVYRTQGREVPGVIASMSHSPDALRRVLQMNSAVTFGGSSLGRYREELIATTVSALNQCYY